MMLVDGKPAKGTIEWVRAQRGDINVRTDHPTAIAKVGQLPERPDPKEVQPIADELPAEEEITAVEDLPEEQAPVFFTIPQQLNTEAFPYVESQKPEGTAT